jgi:hypothetical protein
MSYNATKKQVSNRGIAPDSFLDELVAWGKTASDDIFIPNLASDVYSAVRSTLGPYKDPDHRRAVMLEVLPVLAGFESSWNWNQGIDAGKPEAVTPETTEAGAWQVSSNSMAWGPELRNLVITKAGADDPATFQQAMKQNHLLAMEYIARLLRRTIAANGPVLHHNIDAWLRKDAVAEFLVLLYPNSQRRSRAIDDDCVPQMGRRRF